MHTLTAHNMHGGPLYSSSERYLQLQQQHISAVMSDKPELTSLGSHGKIIKLSTNKYQIPVFYKSIQTSVGTN